MNLIKNNKKGAMFGLDARIALAIFGALSVISGAALYSAIQDAKVTALLAEMNEIGKAYDSYYLDTGKELTVTVDGIFLDTQKLTNDTSTGWQGPYSSIPNGGSVISLRHSEYDDIRLTEALNGTWTDNSNATSWNTSINCDTGTVGGACDIWVMYQNLPSEIYKALDKKVDGTVNGQEGNIRLVQWGMISYHTFLKYRPKQ